MNYEENKTTFRDFAEVVDSDNEYAKLLTWQDILQIISGSRRRRFKKVANWMIKRAIS
jgi:hypothetical protein